MLQVWLIILWLVPWIARPCANYLPVQILTVVIAGFGYWTLTLARTGSGTRLPIRQVSATPDAA